MLVQPQRVEPTAAVALDSVLVPAILRMSAEILAEICLLSILTSSGFHDHKALLNLRWISRRFRDIVIKAHALWCTFDAGALGMHLLPMWLSASGDMPISFRISDTDAPEGDLVYMMGLLCEVSSRWHWAAFFFNTSCTFPRRLALPRLAHLVLRVEDPDLRCSTFSHLPALRSIEVAGIPFSRLSVPWAQMQSLSWCSMRGMSVAEEEPQFKDLKACKNLRRLTGAFRSDKAWPRTRLALPAVTHLRVLCEHGSNGRCTQEDSAAFTHEDLVCIPFSRFALPSLVHLEVFDLGWDVAAFQHFKDESCFKLQSLHLCRVAFGHSELLELLKSLDLLETLSLECVHLDGPIGPAEEEAMLWKALLLLPVDQAHSTKTPILRYLKELILFMDVLCPGELIDMVTSRLPDQVIFGMHGSGLSSFIYEDYSTEDKSDPVVASFGLWTSHGLRVDHSPRYGSIFLEDDYLDEAICLDIGGGVAA